MCLEDLEEVEEEPSLLESSESYSMCSSVLILSFCIWRANMLL